MGGSGYDVSGLKYISHEYGFLFFEVPKNGSGTIIEFLTEQADLTLLKGRFTFLDYPDYKKWAFVRNPWDRILSCYLNKIKADKGFNNLNFKDGVMKKFHHYGVFYAGMPFKEFIEVVAEIPDQDADGHFGSQHHRLMYEGRVIMDMVGRFEQFEQQFREIMLRLGLDNVGELPKFNASGGRHHYSTYYTPDLRELVARRYQEDIELFKYRFETV